MPNLFKLDQKDKKILAALDLNARESNSVIAKQLQLSKNIINYRINQLEQQKIIKSYKTIIDFSKIPLTYVRVYLDLYEFHPEKEDELVQYLFKDKTTSFIAKTVGNWDLVISFSVPHLSIFSEQWSKFREKFRHIIKEYNTSIIIKDRLFPKAYLLDKKQDTSNIFWERGTSEPIELDETDKTILSLLSQNARIPLTEIAKHVNLGSMAIIYRIKLLQKNKVILGYRTELDFSKLGYEYYKVDLELEDPKIIKDLLHHCKAHPNVIAITKAISDNIDFEFDIETKNFDTFLQFMNHLKILFPRAIRDYKYLKYVEILKNN
ncbi:MAG: hypothetical protein A2912_03925 [Candidatus Buchananbacteria bacterium RIFCSPLOWO2_01_FULL_40_23b]|uniref:HTH asnC-type domain-containing protein n=1 Tax=Candidatus Buchananbacteria bacterium RIFCSPLOWO2_01_FULL_40_23b TaxID=1797544 RepID=A0A1G1YN61_9BACT|nr:MAG: hypothetical protein A2912_03925 [Candidatus Buchananbacteria bacterium RIFCSPLOWO2_01_FULL_40_23b]